MPSSTSERRFPRSPADQRAARLNRRWQAAHAVLVRFALLGGKPARAGLRHEALARYKALLEELGEQKREEPGE